MKTMLWNMRSTASLVLDFIGWCLRKIFNKTLGGDNFAGQLHKHFIKILSRDPVFAFFMWLLWSLLSTGVAIVIGFLTVDYDTVAASRQMVSNVIETSTYMDVGYLFVCIVQVAFCAFIREREVLMDELKKQHN